MLEAVAREDLAWCEGEEFILLLMKRARKIAVSSVWAAVPAAGSGRRMAAEIPKQYLKLNGANTEHTLRALLAKPRYSWCGCCA